MFKSLMRELSRGLSPRQRADKVAVQGPQGGDPLQPWQERYAGKSADERRILLEQFALDPLTRGDNVDALCLLGDWQLAAGRLPEAEHSYRRALQAQPLHARSHEGLGLSLLQEGRLEEAFLRLETASRLAPGNAEVWVHWGLVDLELGNIDRASKKFARAVDLAPGNAHAWHNLALATLRLGNNALSIQQFRQAIACKPDHGLAYSNLALVLMQEGQLEEALETAQRATTLKTGNARVWVVLADVQMNAGQPQDALVSLERARTLDPRHIGCYVGLGKLYTSLGQYEAARNAYEAGLIQDPQSADAQSGLGQLFLLQQDWARAWDLYEARRRTPMSPVRNLPFLEWQDEQGGAHHVLVHAEQGLGDIILFGSCVPDLLARGVRCTVEVPQRLAGLFRRSFPDANIIAHEPNDTALDWLSAAPDVDRHVPIGSLPRLFRRAPADFPQRPSFLRADPTRVAHWRRQLDDSRSARAIKVGIAWRGGLATTGRVERSIDALTLAAALAELDVQLVCLQYGNVGADLEAVHATLGLEVHPGLSGFGDLDELAALTCACDAVITVCSTQAHLTGALGRPGAVLVPSAANWRYGSSGSTMPWYPTLELIRQTTPGEWRPVVTNAAAWVKRTLLSMTGPSC